jgi:hypothetical protein
LRASVEHLAAVEVIGFLLLGDTVTPRMGVLGVIVTPTLGAGATFDVRGVGAVNIHVIIITTITTCSDAADAFFAQRVSPHTCFVVVSNVVDGDRLRDEMTVRLVSCSAREYRQVVIDQEGETKQEKEGRT